MKTKEIILVLLLSIFYVNTTILFAQNQTWIPFRWNGASISGKYFDKIAMSVPVTLENLPYKFEMQLDLGAITTVIYGNSIKPYFDEYPQLKSKIDTNLVFRMQNKKYNMLKDFEIKIGNEQSKKINIVFMKDFGDSLTYDSIRTNTVKHIGTVAPDLFKDNILIIDFSKNRLCVVDKLPDDYQNAAFELFTEKQGRIFIPLVIDGKKEDLLFDTGSSIFPLMTTEQRAVKIGGDIIADSLKISSWGDYYMIYGNKIKSKIEFGNKRLNEAIVYYDKQKRNDQFFNNEKIWGITGNAYFLNNIVIIDYKNKKFGVL